METLQVPNSQDWTFYTLQERIPENFDRITAVLKHGDDNLIMLNGHYRRYKTVPDKFIGERLNYDEQDILLWTPSTQNIKP